MAVTKSVDKGQKFLVQFVRIGRGKVTWREYLPRPIAEVDIIRAIKKRKVLMSREVDVSFGQSDWHFTVTAGGRSVGVGVVIPGSHTMPKAEAEALADTYVRETTAMLLAQQEG